MQLNRIRVCEQADSYLRSLKAKTGFTPNLLCRLGFCLSLGIPTSPDPQDYDENSQRELNRYTLTGPWDSFFVTLLKERMDQDNIPMEQIDEQFRAHMNRGVIILFQRVKNISDIIRLCIDENKNLLMIGDETVIELISISSRILNEEVVDNSPK